MKRYFSLLGIIGAVILQISFLPHFSPRGFLPNILLVAVFCWSLLGDYPEAVFWAVGGGILLDLFSPNPLGITAIILLSVVLFLYLMMKSVLSFSHFYSRLWLGILAFILFYSLVYFSSWLYSLFVFPAAKVGIEVDVLVLILVCSGMNIVSFIILFPLLARYQNKINKLTSRLANKI